MLRTGKKNRKSLANRIILWVCLLLVILIAVLITSYLYSLNIVKDNTVNLSSNTITVYSNDITNSLRNMSKSLDEIAFNSSELENLNSKDESKLYYTSMSLTNILNTKINYANDADAYFIVNTENRLVLFRFSNRVTGDENLEINGYFEKNDLSKDIKTQNKWTLIRIENTNYFIKYYDIGSTSIGAMVLADTLMSYVNQTVQTSGYILTDNNGNSLASAGVDQKVFQKRGQVLPNQAQVVTNYKNDYMIVTGNINECGAKLSNVIERDSIFQGMNFIQWTIIGLILLSLVTLIGILIFLSKEIIRPVKQLIKATNKIKSGDWNWQVEFSVTTKEIDLLKNSFNSMIREIKSLKIQSYEEKIERQKVELRYLQMQIRPHFYLNALTTIHSMTYKNKNKEIRGFIEALSNHLRYTLREGLTKVTIKEEINHVEEYIRMQEIKFPNSVFFMPDISVDAEDYFIPQFLILTFVENSFKHAMLLNQVLSILIQAKKIMRENKWYLSIVIEDNGPGYPEEVLQEINFAENLHTSKNGSKIGIINVKRTLLLLFGEDSALTLSNSEPSGARIEVFIPIKEEQENENTDR